MTSLASKPHEWTRTVGSKSYMVSTQKSRLDHDFMHRSFSDESMYWCKDMPQRHLEALVENSCCFGVYTTNEGASQEQVGLARVVTDYISIAYLTDVYMAPEHRGLGLGKWLVRCCKEFAMQIPHLRALMLVTGKHGPATKFYARELGMRDMAEEDLVWMGTDGPGRAVHMKQLGGDGSQ